MSTETHHYYGFSLTEKFGRMQKAMQQIVSGDERFDLQQYMEAHQLGHSHYDGGGWGQVTYVGVDVPMTEQGIVVTDDIRDEVGSIIGCFPDEFRKALIEVFGEVPRVRFDYEQSDG